MNALLFRKSWEIQDVNKKRIANFNFLWNKKSLTISFVRLLKFGCICHLACLTEWFEKKTWWKKENQLRLLILIEKTKRQCAYFQIFILSSTRFSAIEVSCRMKVSVAQNLDFLQFYIPSKIINLAIKISIFC